MASTSSAPSPGIFDKVCVVRNNVSLETYGGSDFDTGTLSSYLPSQCKKRRISIDMYNPSCWAFRDIKACLPVLHSSDYFMEPSLLDLAAQELNVPGHCCHVQNFTVGRFGYGCVKFLGETDIRWLELDKVIKFDRHRVVVYEDETDKPAIGEGLNKAAEVTLVLQIKPLADERFKLDKIVEKLKIITEKQGARFVSFNPLNGEWKFLVCHFSRFGLSEDDEDDIIMDEAAAAHHLEEQNGGELFEVDEVPQIGPDVAVLSHSLPAHLGLDPIKMQEMRMVMFPAEEEETEDFDGTFSLEKQSFSREFGRPALQYSSRKMSHRVSPPIVRKTPQALLEYNMKGSDQPGNILMTRQNLSIVPRTTKVKGFQLDLKDETPVTGHHSKYAVDAGLFMGRSFRVGWGPNGVLVHCGNPVSSTGPGVLSSIVHVEKIAINKVVRDENNKVKEELNDCCFASPLSLHKSISHETMEVEVEGSFRLKLQKVVSDRLVLPEICRSYIDIIEKQLDVPCLSASARGVLMHQVMVWELIKVLFSAREISGHSISVDVDDEEDMMGDKKDGSPDIDPEALPFVRRAQFSYWLQESVCHQVQEEISCLNESCDLEHIFLLLTGRQLDVAVELSASRGDVRLACLLSQAGGSTVNRSDMARQLDLWRINGLDFNFIEKDRLRLYELLAGNIQGALQNSKIDWKRYLGLLMWYQLPPDTSLSAIIHTYQQLLDAGKAPYPIPVYIDEGLVEEAVDLSDGDRFDLAYYLMLLHANEESEFGVLKTMFSAFSSTFDPLDYHMLWHQRSVLEAVGAFCSNDLHVLDMSFVSQLLCLGQCHWAIYVVLHMPYRDDFPNLQATVIREILFQYCESWSSQERHHQFIKDLGVPSAWLHEAMAVYFHYEGDLLKALEHFVECSNWQKAHSIFVTSVAHSLFLSAKHLEIWRLAVSMEEHKSEIANWDLGAGIYISFYVLKDSIRDGAMYDPDSLEKNKASCREFFDRVNASLAVWGSRLPVDARATYSVMAEELCTILISDGGEAATYEDQLSCFETMFKAPLPEDLHECHLQDAVSAFTCYLTEIAS
ncbi:nuclear pore complex protein NUP96 [Macadamia integrifolia]|uniref:nuclear pore complex protein NUP96 n=1 Tax=Macadamia integrifolia TaxID=60698 RepID=UPI001C4FEF4C|nr:nuclear pore complex protein NUP96 [Macadamia integrifolia]